MRAYPLCQATQLCCTTTWRLCRLAYWRGATGPTARSGPFPRLLPFARPRTWRTPTNLYIKMLHILNKYQKFFNNRYFLTHHGWQIGYNNLYALFIHVFFLQYCTVFSSELPCTLPQWLPPKSMLPKSMIPLKACVMQRVNDQFIAI